MESSSHQTFVNTKAITIPLHNGVTSSRHLNTQHSNRRGYQRQRPSNPERADSDVGNASSLGSDWTCSPISPPQSADPSRLGLHVTMASPPVSHQTTVESASVAGGRQRKDKQRAGSNELPPDALPPLFSPSQSPLGPSMISNSAYKSVNLNSHHNPESNEPARLITYTKYAQGFTWNDELFLPSYLLSRHRYRHGSGVRRRWGGGDDEDDIGEFEEDGERCPVTDIFVTDEEAAAMMP